MNDHATFTRLVAEQHFLLESFVAAATRGRGGPELVEELVQQSIGVAWRRFGSHDRSRPFGPWLRGIASRVVRAHFRREARRERIHGGPSFAAGFLAELARRFDTLDPQRRGQRTELLASLRACVDRLDPEFAESIRLHYRDGLAVADVAIALRIEVELVRKRLQRARARLADCLATRGFRPGSVEVRT